MTNKIVGYTESGKVKFLCCKYKPRTNRGNSLTKQGVCETFTSECPLEKGTYNRRCKGTAKMIFTQFLIFNQEASSGRRRSKYSTSR